MLKVTSETRLFVASKPLDFRKGLDRTLALIEHLNIAFSKSGAYFVFFNRRRTHARVVCYTGAGYWLATKRLSRGTFLKLPHTSLEMASIPGHELVKLLQETITEKTK